MQLSIVILQTNKPRDVEACLRALQRAQLPSETEVIVLNNGGEGANGRVPTEASDGLQVTWVEIDRHEAGKRFPDGYIYGNNLGYQLAKGSFIATLNADVTVNPQTLWLLVEHLRQHPETGLVAPRLVYPSGEEQEVVRHYPRFLELASRRLHGTQTIIDSATECLDADWVVGALFVMTRRCLDATGGHDPRFHLFMSDIALGLDTWRAGLKVQQLRTAQATHHETRLSAGSPWTMLRKRTGRIHIMDALRYFWRELGRSVPPQSPSGGAQEHARVH